MTRYERRELEKELPEKVVYRYRAIENEYNYLIEPNENSGGLTFMSANVGGVILSVIGFIVCSGILLYYEDTISDTASTICSILALLFALGFVGLMASPEIPLHIFFKAISFIFDIIFAIILLPRKIFRKKKKAFVPDENDIFQTYSDLSKNSDYIEYFSEYDI